MPATWHQCTGRAHGHPHADPEEEALRELIRVREDLKDDRRKTMHSMKSVPLARARRYPAGRAWTDKFDLWVPISASRSLRPGGVSPPPRRLGYPQRSASGRRRRDRDVPASSASQVGKLRCSRGIDPISAVTLAADVSVTSTSSDPPPRSWGFTGLVSSEYPKAPSHRRGSITMGRQRASSRGPSRGRLQLLATPCRRGRAPPAEPGGTSRGVGVHQARS